MPRRWLLLLLTLLVAGCAPKEMQWGGQLTRAPRAVVSLSPNTSEILAIDGNQGQLQGRTSACNYPLFVPTLPVYGGVKPDYEKLAANRPDLIVFDSDLYSDADKAKLNELHLPVFEFKAKTVDEFITAVRELSKAVNAPMGLSPYVDRIIQARANAGNNTGTPPKVAAVDGTLIAGSGSFLADVIKSSGGTPVGPEGDRFMKLNPEQLIQMNPDIILVAADVSSAGTDKAKRQQLMEGAALKFMQDPRYQALKAVRTRRVSPVDADVLLRKGSRVDKLIEGITNATRSFGEKS